MQLEAKASVTDHRLSHTSAHQLPTASCAVPLRGHGPSSLGQVSVAGVQLSHNGTCQEGHTLLAGVVYFDTWKV